MSLERSDTPEGRFFPALPRDHGEVLRLYCVAARVAVVSPATSLEISELLASLNLGSRSLQMTASECERYWQQFLATLPAVPAERYDELGRAYLAGLEEIASRLDQAPLPEWESLPLGVDERNSKSVKKTTKKRGVKKKYWNLSRIQKEARASFKKNKKTIDVHFIASLVERIEPQERGLTVDAVVKDQNLTRVDRILLERFVSEPFALSEEDEVLLLLMEQFGKWLLR